jgi:DNA mismatch repair protein MutL
MRKIFFKHIRYLGSFQKTILIFKTKNSFLLVDQHTAHERVIFNDFKTNYNFYKSTCKYIYLITPIKIKYQSRDFYILKRNVSDIKGIGVNIYIKQGCVIISSYLQCYRENLLKKIISLYLNHYSSRISSYSLKSIVLKKLFESAACRSAVKSGDAVSEHQALKLLNKLLSTTNNKFCPHGRLVFKFVKMSNIIKCFSRKHFTRNTKI